MADKQNSHLYTGVLWLLVVIDVAETLTIAIFPGSIPRAILIPTVVAVPALFALLHGARRHGWAGILVFLAVCLAVSNAFENLSILTGFPFGHYHYTDNIGPKLFLVPVLIGPAYFGTGYLAWVLGGVLVADVRARGSAFTSLAVPFIASFLMVAWDLGMDPTNSTIRQNWIWQQGGGYFGVPLTNYLGWSLTVYVFFQLFALYLHRRNARGDAARASMPTSHFVQATVMYAFIGIGIVLGYPASSGNSAVTDAAGVVWQTRSIAEGEAVVGIYTILFMAALAAVKLAQRPAAFTRRSMVVAAASAIPAMGPLTAIDLGEAAETVG